MRSCRRLFTAVIIACFALNRLIFGLLYGFERFGPDYVGLPLFRDTVIAFMAGAGEAAAVVARRVLEHRGISVTQSRRPLARDTALVEQAEQTTAGERALQSTGERGRDGLADRHAREVGEDTVGETWNASLPVLMNPTSESSAPEKAFANARSVAVAASLLSAT
jgi:hypothetical protein